MIIVFFFPANPNPGAAGMNYTVVVLGTTLWALWGTDTYHSFLGGTLVLATVYYYFPKYGGINWFKGPVSTIGEGWEIAEANSDIRNEGKDDTESEDDRK